MNYGISEHKVKKYLKEVDEIFKQSVELTIYYKDKIILVSALYSGNKKRPSSYTVSMMNSDKYYYKCNTRSEAMKKVKKILKKEGFKDKEEEKKIKREILELNIN